MTPTRIRTEGRKPAASTHNSLIASIPTTITPKMIQTRYQHDSVTEIIDKDDTYLTMETKPLDEELRIDHTQPLNLKCIKRTSLRSYREVTESPLSKRVRQPGNLTTIDEYCITVKGHIIKFSDFTIKRFNRAYEHHLDHRHSQTWSGLDPPPQWELLPNKKPHPSLPKSIFFLRYMIMHNNLFIGPKMAHILPNAEHNTTICYNCNIPASTEHCFLECPLAIFLWTQADQLLETLIGTRSRTETGIRLFGPPDTRHDNDKALDIMTGLTVWTIREAHYDYVFQNKRTNVLQLSNRHKTQIAEAATITDTIIRKRHGTHPRWGSTRLASRMQALSQSVSDTNQPPNQNLAPQ